jgi:DNA-binding SARP family transcriptional activator
VWRLRTFGGIWIEDLEGGTVPPPRPRRMALLAVLASGGGTGVPRSKVLGIFWPEVEEHRARHALSQTIYALHGDLGRAVVKGDSTLRLDAGILTSEAEDFERAVERKDWASAASLYRGRFADGFAVAASPDFDHWLDETQRAFQRKAVLALEALARDAEHAGDLLRAGEVWGRLAAVDPLSARIAVAYMNALAALGDLAGAIAHARRHTDHVRQELEVEPDAKVTALAATFEGRLGPAATPSSLSPMRPAASEPARVETVPQARETAPVRHASRRAGALVGVAAIAAALALAVWSGRPSTPAPVLAVGRVRDLTAGDTSAGGALSEMLATSLGRLSDVEVIANSRILELVAAAGASKPTARSDAAKRAGASEILEGELLAIGDGLLRLNLRRVDIARGALRRGYTVTGSDRFAILDSAASLLAADLRIPAPTQPLAELTTRSPVALRFYEEGLRAYYEPDLVAAERLFRSALTEDSTFGLAAYHLYWLARAMGRPDSSLEARALRLADRAPERERLLILTAVRSTQFDTRAPFLAETLAIRFPRDPEALLTAAEALTVDRLIGPRERELLERAIALDSAAGESPQRPCGVCRSLVLLADRLKWADSLPAADRALERFLRFRPDEAWPIRELAMHQFYQGRYEAGATTLQQLAAFPGQSAPFDNELFVGRLLTGRLDDADAQCAVKLRQADPRAVAPYRWLCPIVWRNQGRYRDASAFLVSRRLPNGDRVEGDFSRDFVGEAILQFEMGHPDSTLLILESLVPRATGPGEIAGEPARELTWSLARRGMAAAAAGRLELTAHLADSAEAIGRNSLYGRDRLLHFYLRGLLASAAGDHRAAADFFRRSIFSWTFGFTRANLELARSLLAIGRAGEAIPAAQSALRGGWDGSNLYVSRTELHEVLAQAFDATGQRDSAAVHYALVERSWRLADPMLTDRYERARAWLARNVMAPKEARTPRQPRRL